MRRKPAIGETWTAKVSGNVVEVKVLQIASRASSAGFAGIRHTTRYVCKNLKTGRTIDVHRNRLRDRVVAGHILNGASGLFVFLVKSMADPDFTSSPSIVAASEAKARERLAKTYPADTYTIVLTRELS